MKYIKLSGSCDDPASIQADIAEIKRVLEEDNSIIFIYSGPNTLYDYITDLNDKGRGLDDELLYQFKVCYENKNLSVSYSQDKGAVRKISTMSGLVNALDGADNCRIVVETDNRVELAFIVQQLIFIEYPLDKVDILLRKEERDADKTRRFMDNVAELMTGCGSALRRLAELRRLVEQEQDNTSKEERIQDIDAALDSFRTIQKQIEAAVGVELKFAVAASKKAGKSVIVNCFLGEEIAPTSTQLATPNNCIYSKSTDGQYSLQMAGKGVERFAAREEIHDAVFRYFREAQNSRETGYALPDMHIQYVTEENNFSSYTIFDTAGPDAAGTGHEGPAMDAMTKCDVAVFAIDYSKYLIKSEEEYLREIKRIFTAQNKFHSLMFALNKMDVRYTDEDAPKSFIGSVDFIRIRLAEIDEAYRDCIIFPTSSKEYFNAIEAEKAGVQELVDGLESSQMRQLTFRRRDVPALKWLHSHSEYLAYYHGIKEVSYDVFKKDSGMPALMNYVSYVARSKARDEIVNNIANNIANQRIKIQSVLDYIPNIDALINTDDKKIAQISEIINTYTDRIREIFTPDFNQGDLAVLKDDSLLRTHGGFQKIMEVQERALELLGEKEAVAETIYSAVTEKIWKRLEENKDENKQISDEEIGGLFGTSDFNDAANDAARSRLEEAASLTHKQMSKLSREVETIVRYRQYELEKASRKCKDDLSKQHIDIELPALPDFEFATKMTSPGKTMIHAKKVDLKLHDRMETLFKKRAFDGLLSFLSRIFSGKSEHRYNIKADKKDFYKLCEENLKGDIMDAVSDNNVAETLLEQLHTYVIGGYLGGLSSELEQVFASMNDTYTFCVEKFKKAIDDRAIYKNDIERHEKRKGTILNIEAAAADFMGTWDKVVRDVTADEEGVDAKWN